MFGFIIEDLFVGKFAERAKLNQQSSCFRRVGYLTAHFARLKIDVAVWQTGRRIKDRQQTVAQIFGKIEEAFVAGQLITREQTTEQPNRSLKVLHLDVFVERKV